jgi:acyl-CoA thioesterase-1
MQKRIIILLFISYVLCCYSCSENKTAEKESPTNVTADTASKQVTKKTVLFFGNSLTAGYGLEPSQAFSALIAKRIDSLGLPYEVINAGVSGETSSGGDARIDWILKQDIDVFVLELGGNDGLRGIEIAETKKNLQSIIDKVRAKNPETKMILAGMQIPPNMGQDYTTAFKNLYPELAQKNKMIFIPFLLEGVGGEASLNLDDGIHPNEEGQKIVAENVWKALKDVL